MPDDTIPDAGPQGEGDDEAMAAGAGSVLDFLFNAEMSALPESGGPHIQEGGGETPESAELSDALAKYASWLDSLG